MPKITIRERQQTDPAAEGAFAATVSIDGQSEYPITVRDPFDQRQEQDLEFYFEQWIRFPFDQQVRSQRAAESITGYGQQLFENVFADRDAYSEYQQACRGGLANLEIEIAGESPDFQALHWEAMKDPKLPRPLAVDCVFTRKRIQRGVVSIDLQPSPEINLLVVTARPDEEKDVGYRTISRPLIDAIEAGRLRVNVELLRPGTFEALSTHLEGKAGFYHIVHFDVHGGLMSYQQFQQDTRQDRYLYQMRYGRGDIAPYDGEKAFLFLEGESPGKADPVEAQELADLLTSQGIPICILNACQSGKQVGTPVGALHAVPPPESDNDNPNDQGPIALEIRETSLGSRLMTAGVQMVVAMGYSVTVSAAALMMEKLYGELFAERGIPEAIRRGRKALYNDKDRRAYFNQTVKLEDWLLPVVYANKSVDLRLRPMSPEQEEAYFEAEDVRFRFAAAEQTTYGFVGRDLEILKIEKALLRHNVLLLQGMGGTGKTTLLNYLRDWWQRTNFVVDTFYFGYDKKAYTLQQILQEIGKRVFNKLKFASFQAMGLGAQRRKLADALKAERYAIVLDNLESVTGEALAIQNTLPEAEQGEIRKFLLALKGGQTKVVLGSRSDEAWLRETFTVGNQVNRYRLRGLDAEARTLLAEKILAATALSQRQIEEIRQDKDFGRLMTLLAGYPLAMEVVLANLGRQSAAEVLAGLDAADVDLDSGTADKTKSILKCVEYSHSNLSATAQKLLLCLAPFKGIVFRFYLPQYAQQLQQLEPFAEWEFDQFEAAVDEAIRWGLLSPYSDGNDGLLRIQPMFPYFLKTKLADADKAVREGLETGFKEHYRGLAAQYQQMVNSKESEQRKLGLFFCGLEYENLFSALQTCLDCQENIEIYFCLYDYFLYRSDSKGGTRISCRISEALLNYPDSFLIGEHGYQVAFVYERLATSLLALKQYGQAKHLYTQALCVYEKNNVIDNRQKELWKAGDYYNLGVIAHELREYEQARAHYKQALDICIKHGDHYKQASIYNQMGKVAEELREYKRARMYCEQALDIFTKYDERHKQADAHHNLGIIAQEIGEYEQARMHYQQALGIRIEYGDRYNRAFTYHQLGRVAEELREYEQARMHYQQELDLHIEHGDRYSSAFAYHHLGSVSESLREYEQAKSHYHQALSICIEYGDYYKQANIHHHLGIVAWMSTEYEQAREHYQQALDIFMEYGDRYSQAGTYGQLGTLYLDFRELENSRQSYQKALDIHIDYDDQISQSMDHHNLGVIAQALMDYERARAHYQQALNICIEYGDRYSQARTYHQLGSVAEELGEYEQAMKHYQQALIKFVEFNDDHNAVIVLTSFNRLQQTTQDDSLLTEVAQCLNATVEEVTQLFDNLNNNSST